MDNKKLTFEELNHVQREVSYNTKSVPLTYILSIFLGFLGIHRVYFGKNKSAIIRSLVTLINGIILFMIASNMANIDVNSELVTDVLAYNAVLAIALILFTIINISWSILDLFLIPKWKRDLDYNLKKEATDKLIQARYVSEHLLKEQISKELVEQAKREIVIKVDEMLKFMNEEKLSELGKTLIPALEDNIVFNEKPKEEKSIQEETYEEPIEEKAAYEELYKESIEEEVYGNLNEEEIAEEEIYKESHEEEIADYEEPYKESVEEEIYENLNEEEIAEEEVYEESHEEEIAEEEVEQEKFDEEPIEEVFEEKQSSKMESPLKIALQEYLDKKAEVESKDDIKPISLSEENTSQEDEIIELQEYERVEGKVEYGTLSNKEIISDEESEINKEVSKESEDAPKEDLVKQNDIEENSIAKPKIESVANEEKESKQDNDVSEDKVDYITVAQAIDKGEGVYTVKGFVVNSVEKKVKKSKRKSTEKNSMIAIADNPEEKDKGKMLTVRLPRNTQINSKDSGKLISVRGNLEMHLGKPVIQRISKISIEQS